MLSDGIIHRVIRRTGVGRKGLGFNLCVAPPHDRIVPNFRVMEITEVFRSRPEQMEETCYGCNTKLTRYSCYSSNVPRLHISLQVELLTPFTSGLPFLLCSSFVLTLLIRKHRLVVLSFCSIVLCSQTYLQSETLNSLLCSISGYCACCAP